MGFPLVVANAQGKDITDQVLDRCEMAVFNEGGAALHKGMRAKPGWSEWIPEQGAGVNCMAWRPDQLKVTPLSTAVITVGGRIGLSRVLPKKFRKDRRRLGPSRRLHSAKWTDRNAVDQLMAQGLSNVDVVEQASGIIHFAHLPARSQSVERWRWPVMLDTFRRMRRHMYAVRAENPGLPEIFCGDTNLRRVPKVFLGRGWKRVKLAPDLGGSKYTQVWYRQAAGHRKVVIANIGKFPTRADHDAEKVFVRLGGLA